MVARFDDLPDISGLTVGILGGTGREGKGLARRFVAAGQSVLIGSREAERAKQVAEQLGARGADNATVAAEADIVIVAVPWRGHKAMLESLREQLAGKIVVDCVNPMGFDDQGAYALTLPEGSAAQQAAALLPDSRVVAAFNHVSSAVLSDPSLPALDLDVLVVGDDDEAVATVQTLAALIPGVRGVHAGPLRHAHQIEALTANLYSINIRYKIHAGVRIAGL